MRLQKAFTVFKYNIVELQMEHQKFTYWLTGEPGGVAGGGTMWGRILFGGKAGGTLTSSRVLKKIYVKVIATNTIKCRNNTNSNTKNNYNN